MTAAQAGPETGRVTGALPTSNARAEVRRSLAWRVAASCLAVALVAVAVAGVVALRLVSETARQVTQDVLAQEADIVAAQLADPALIGNPGPVRQAAASRKLVQTLQGQGVDIVLLGRARTGTGPIATALTKADADRSLSGTPVSASVDVAGRTYVVEARPAATGAFALVRRSDTGPLGNGLIRRNLGFALLAGGGVALVVGLVVGTLMARPLRRTATAAHLLRGGRRDVRVPVQGPAEVAEVAGAVNDLADALARSEARQREFLLSVSHELRTPLTAVRGFAESLADGVVTGEDVAPTGATIVAEAARLDRLVGDLMELARLEADDFRLDLMTVDLAALAREAAAVWDARCRATGRHLHLARAAASGVGDRGPPAPAPGARRPGRERPAGDARGRAAGVRGLPRRGAAGPRRRPWPRPGRLRRRVRPGHAARALPRPPPRRRGRRRPRPRARPGRPHGRRDHRRARRRGRGVLHGDPRAPRPRAAPAEPTPP